MVTETDSLKRLVAKAGTARVLPTAARKVLEAMDNPEATSATLAEVIGHDQALAAYILKVANSAFFALASDIKTVPMAVTILGFKTIRDLSLAVAVRSIYKRFGITEKLLWDHSLFCALAARTVASAHAPDLQEDAFVCGLLHDMGKVILNNEEPERFAEVMMLTYNRGLSSVAAEMQVFGFTHTDVGRRVAIKWRFPAVIVDAIARHHNEEEPQEAPESTESGRLVACVQLANGMSKLMGIGYRQANPEAAPEKSAAVAALGIAPERVEPLLQQAREVYDRDAAAWG